MKAIIYAGIGLFSVATVYGLADYYSSQKKGTLDKLYVEETTTIPLVEEKTTAAIPATLVETRPAEAEAVTVRSNKKVRSADKEIKMEDFSRARIPEPVVKEYVEAPIEKKEEIKIDKVVGPAEKTEVTEVIERKLTLDKYSRAPLKKQVKKVKKTEL